MIIKIKDRNLCENCTNKTCSFVDAVVKHDFFDIRTETTVCPTGVLLDGLDLDTDNITETECCVHCGICIKTCHLQNINGSISESEKCNYSKLTETQLNAIAGTYLNRILGFAANTNRNRSMAFDGYAVHRTGLRMFVEVDWNNDSLECTRRLLGDFLTNPSNVSIKTGLVILQDLPERGTHDTFNTIKKLNTFPTTADVCIYFSTFDILRNLYLDLENYNYTMDELFHNPLVEDTAEYVSRINALCKRAKKNKSY